jgi:hypothetical protein
MKDMKASGDAKRPDLPYVEEMNDLISKEKHLLHLKVLEQQREAEEWKAKYMSVVSKVGDAANKTGDYRAMEFVGDASSSSPSSSSAKMNQGSSSSSFPASTNDGDSTVLMKKVDATPEGMQQLLLSLKHKWMLELSPSLIVGDAVKVDLLKAVNNEVFSIRASDKNSVSVFAAERCDLDDHMAVTLGSILSKNVVESVNLSYNHLGPSFLIQLINALKARRKTPQYINISGNTPMATVDLTPLLKNFTDSTWGIICSLQDQSHGQVSEAGGHGHDSASKKSGGTAKAKKGASKAPEAIYSSGHEPKKALSFLTHLLSTLNPAGSHSGSDGTNKKTAGGKSAPAKAKNAAGKKAAGAGDGAGAPGIIRTSSITTLSVFGLTCNYLCIESVSMLGSILDAAAPSMTDLDLSFSYIGVNGCKMLRQALSSKGCQLVRLGLTGNNIGDAGADELGLGLRQNRTLTYLDIRSNTLEPQGLRSLCFSLTGAALGGFDGQKRKESKTSPNNVLFHIDLRGNLLPETSVHAARNALQDWGLSTHLQSGPQYQPVGGSNATDDSFAPVMFDSAPANTASGPIIKLYQQPAKRSVGFSVGMGDPSGGGIYAGRVDGVHLAALYTIDLKFVNSHFLSRDNHCLRLEWSMRPVAEKTSENGKDVSESWLMAPYKLGWDVLFVTATSSKVLVTGTLSSGSSLSSQHSMDAHWARCMTLVRDDIPMTGTLVIRAVALDDGSARVPAAIEACDCTIVSVPSAGYRAEGGDFFNWAPADCSTVSLSTTNLDEPSQSVAMRVLNSKVVTGIEDFSFLRVLKHGGLQERPLTNVKMCWSSKLVSDGGSGGNSALRHDIKGLGYEWVVLVEQALRGNVIEVARGECSMVTDHGDDNMDSPQDDIENVLSPWRWLATETELSQPVGCGDNVILLARVKSLYEGSLVKEESLGRPACSVVARNCVLSVPDVTRDADVKEVGVGVFTTHNAPLAML